MRVLVISTNQETYPYSVAPLGAAAVVASLARAGHEAELLDLGFKASPVDSIDEALSRFEPELVGLSIRNLDGCSYHYPSPYLEPTRDVVATVSERTTAPIVVGGSALAVGKAAFIRYLGAPYGVVGEGEKSVVALLEALEGRASIDDVPGLIRNIDGKLIANPPDFSCDLDAVPLNEVSTIDYKPYFARGGFVGLQARRGCPLRCTYCNYPAIEGTRYRLRSPRLIVDDMERVIREKDLRDFFFADSVFNQPAHHALAICQEISRRGLELRWMAYCNPGGLDDDMAEAFKASGCLGVELGLDAATDKMLAVLDKGFEQRDIARACEALAKHDIPFAHFLLFGGPGETWDDIREAQKFLDAQPEANAIFASLGIRIYQDTPMQKLAIESGTIEADAPLLEPTFYRSEELGLDHVAEFDRFAATTITWITPTDWETPMVRRVHEQKRRLRDLPTWLTFRDFGRMRRGEK